MHLRCNNLIHDYYQDAAHLSPTTLSKPIPMQLVSVPKTSHEEQEAEVQKLMSENFRRRLHYGERISNRDNNETSFTAVQRPRHIKVTNSFKRLH